VHAAQTRNWAIIVSIPSTDKVGAGTAGADAGAATMLSVAVVALLTGFGSLIALAAVTVEVTVPLAGATNENVHAIDAPAASVATGEAGEHELVIPAGRPEIVHDALLAALGPLLVQV
jgi:hypothetical protein